MKKLQSLFLALIMLIGLSISHTALAEGEAAKSPSDEAKAVAEPANDAAGKVEAAKVDDSMADADEPEEESEDVKILREAAAKLKASDPGLSAKLEQLAEDFSW